MVASHGHKVKDTNEHIDSPNVSDLWSIIFAWDAGQTTYINMYQICVKRYGMVIEDISAVAIVLCYEEQHP